MRHTLLLLTLLTLPVAALAGHSADFYVIPVVAHVPGANNTLWMSDVAIHNFNDTPLSVEMIFIESGAITENVEGLVPPESFPASIPPFGSAILKDVLQTASMQPTSGSLLIGGDQAFAVTSRTYSMSPAGDTVGQTVLPVSRFIESAPGEIPQSARAYLPGLISNANFRTNLGFAAATENNAGGMLVEVTLRGAQGNILGRQTIFVPGGDLMHVQFSTRTMTDASFDAGAAEFRIIGGNGSFVPYASVIDNRTADAVYVTDNLGGTSGANAATEGAKPLFRRVFDLLTAARD